jgi:magnesium transporter
MLDLLSAGYMSLHPADAARTLARLDERELVAFLAESPTRLAAQVLSEMAPSAAARAMQRMDTDILARIVAHMPTEAAAQRLHGTDRAKLRALYAALPRMAAVRLRIRLRYPEGAVGSLIDTDVLTLTPELRVLDAVRMTRRTADRLGHRLYVLDERRRLKGSVDICRLLTERDRTPVGRIMEPVQVRLNSRASIQTVENHPAWITNDSLPVVNREGVFEGILPRSSVVLEDQSLYSAVEEQQDLSTTQLALSDVFWMAVTTLFVGGPSSKPTTGD